MRLLIPSSNRRRNEFVGLLWMALALLLLLSLASFSPTDPSFNSVAASPTIHNWAGTLGAYSADLLFQLLGVCAFLLPLGMAWIGWQWFRSRLVESLGAKLCGALLLTLSLLAALSLQPYPLRLHQVFPLAGVAGVLLAEGLRSLLNGPGSAILLTVTTLASLYLLTAFSMERTSAWLRARFGWLGKISQRWEAWKASWARQRPLPKAVPPEHIRPVEATWPTPAVVEPRPPCGPEPTGGGPSELPIIPIQPPAESLPARPVKNVARSQTSHSYKLPPTSLLHPPVRPPAHVEEDLKRLASILTLKCEEFDVRGTVTQINPGPVVTTFELKPEPGVKYSRITNLAEDLCLALEAESILIERIPGKSTVGIEVPNMHRETIVLREILESEAFVSPRSPLIMALGKEINGKIRVADLTSMPHLLIAGSTGSGKSVSLNCMILSVLLKATPEEVKMILVDPKRLELGLYDGVPHLITPIITDPKVAANALRNSVREMERRLKLLADKGVRNIEQYNKLADRPESLNLFDAEQLPERLPYIVIFIDELADLLMVDSSNVEVSVTRLAQMARAVGIHLVLATQRPSVDVITGLIKANFPARISFRVATKVDSRTILDSNGAEALLGKGDMLYSPPGSGRLVRVHGPLVTEEEIAQVVEFWRAQASPSYSEEFLKPPAPEEEEEGEEEEWTGEKDEMYEEAVRVVVEMGKASTSVLQRRMRLGYGRAARLLDIMEKDGIIGPADGSRPREVLKRPDWIEEFERSRSNA